MLNVLKVKSSGYYYWLGYPESMSERRNRELIGNIRRVYDNSKKIYGKHKFEIDP